MVTQFGGLGFRYMDLFCMGGTQGLLYGCADALEKLRLYAGDICGEERYSKDMRASQRFFQERGPTGIWISLGTRLCGDSKSLPRPSLEH